MYLYYVRDLANSLQMQNAPIHGGLTGLHNIVSTLS